MIHESVEAARGTGQPAKWGSQEGGKESVVPSSGSDSSSLSMRMERRNEGTRVQSSTENTGKRTTEPDHWSQGMEMALETTIGERQTEARKLASSQELMVPYEYVTH